ncbi:hypothetical protein [Butyrivibrio sp.]|uniref:hypothetical protein n=1 Tax=Butyrivibrio sp. TaxID=28121 RepID=UPI0025C471D9|nr:hypothetical protein [Butyrivibrio sp.]MBE5837317.1 hypothetical protein [Butyrivibrio sp.]
MYKFEIYGLNINSDIEFEQLRPWCTGDRDAQNEIIVKKENIKDEVNLLLKDTDMVYKITYEVSCFKNSRGYFLIKNGSEIYYEPRENKSVYELKTFILGYCISMVLLQRMIITIHCSAVCPPKDSPSEGAFLIAGMPGAGKSTITRKLLEKGFLLMADDVAAIKKEEDALVYPAFPYQKLCRNEVEKRHLDMRELVHVADDEDKFFVPVREAFESTPQRLKGMFILMITDGTDVEIQKLSGLSQFMTIRQNLFLHRLKGEWESKKELMELCMEVAKDCPVYVIARPDGIDTTDDITHKIIEIAERF